MTARRRRGGRRFLGVFAAALLVVPLLEIAVIIAVGRVIGGWPTFLLLLVESALGAVLVRREGARAWTALTTALSSGRMPTGELSDAALILVGGTLLLTPGFITDVFGFFFVLPFTRPLARRLLTRVVERRLLGGTVGAAFRPGQRPADVVRGEVVDDDVIEGEVIDDTPPGDDGAGRT